MPDSGPSLPQRIAATLHQKQRLVFFAVLLYALDSAVPLLSGWLYRHEPVADLLAHDWGPLPDAIAARSALIGTILIAYLLSSTWLRAGYIRSLVGSFHWRPRDTRQFFQLLGLEVLLEAVGASLSVLTVWLGDGSYALVAVVASYAYIAFALAALYADYIIVLDGVGPVQAIVQSVRMVRTAILPSSLILLVLLLLGQLAPSLYDETTTSTVARFIPMLLVECTLMGGAAYVADVALITLYQNATLSGKLPRPESAGRPSL